jgi:hypothetical protein
MPRFFCGGNFTNRPSRFSFAAVIAFPYLRVLKHARIPDADIVKRIGSAMISRIIYDALYFHTLLTVLV